MEFSFHPKYLEIADEVMSFLDENVSRDNKTKFSVGGDGSLFAYVDLDAVNFLISSHKFSKGYYSACFFEDNYKEKILEYFKNPKKYEKEFQTIEVLVNGKPLAERAINEVMIGKDYMFKAIVNKNIVNDTGLIVYTPDGCNAWAGKYGGKIYDSLGWVLMDKRESLELKDSLEIEVLKYHELEVMIDGKGHNLDLYYKHCSTRDRDKIFTKPWSLNAGDLLTIKAGKPVKIVKMETFRAKY
jgi:hypothetical protein